MKKKNLKPIVISALLAVGFGASTVGTSFALFTDKADTSIQVTAGKVQITNSMTITEAKSLNSTDDTSVAAGGLSASFVNGGAATVDNTHSEVTIEKWTPGDELTLTTNPINGSNVKTKMRMVVKMEGNLAPALVLTIKNGEQSFQIGGKKSFYMPWAEFAPGLNPAAYSLNIKFPDHDDGEIVYAEANKDNQYQEKQAIISVNFEAVQANANVNDLLERVNSRLATEEIADGKANATMEDAFADLTGLLTPDIAKENSFVWSAEADQFVREAEVTSGDEYKYFKVFDSAADAEADGKYSVYANATTWAPTVSLTGIGFDAGEASGIISISYIGASEARTNTIRTNSSETSLTINAPLDTVNHYGDAQVITLTAVSGNSYYEHGSVDVVDVKKGRLVITSDTGADVGTIYLAATNNGYDNIILATQKGSALPNLVAREQVDLPTEGQKLVVTIQTNVNEQGVQPEKTEKIYLYPQSDVKEATKGYDVTDLGLMVVEAISSQGRVEAAEQLADKGESVIESVEETKVDDKDNVIAEAAVFNNGDGTLENPYKIANGNQWYIFIRDYNDKYIGKRNGSSWDNFYVTLTGDLDMENYSISDFVTYPYNLNLDGNGHKFTNLDSTIWGYYGDYYGHCSIKNVKVEDSYAKYSIFGYGPVDSNVTVDLTDVTIKNSEANGGMFMYYTTGAKINFERCIVENSLVHGPNNMGGGGFVGNGQGITINNSKFGGSIVAESTNMVAGFVGQGKATITNSEITEGSIIRSIAANGKVAAYDGQGGGAGETDNNQFNGTLSCDKESNAYKQGTNANWVQFVGLKNTDFELGTDGTITYVGENERNFSKVTISEYIFQKSEYFRNGDSGQTGKNAYILGGYSCYWEDLIQADVTSNTIYKVDRVTSIVNVVNEYYADKIAFATSTVPNVTWTRYSSYLDRQSGTLYFDGRRADNDHCTFIGESADVTSEGVMTPKANPYGDFYIVIKAYDANGIIGSATLSYRVNF